MPTWIAINLRDFHKPEKAWQRGTEAKVETKVIRARTMEQAKETAQYGNNEPWMVFNISGTKNIIYAKTDAELTEKIEGDLRALWAKRGVPKERQEEILREVAEKAKPGAQVGPFKIPE
jgi:hypothetical protein